MANVSNAGSQYLDQLGFIEDFIHNDPRKHPKTIFNSNDSTDDNINQSDLLSKLNMITENMENKLNRINSQNHRKSLAKHELSGSQSARILHEKPHKKILTSNKVRNERYKLKHCETMATKVMENQATADLLEPSSSNWLQRMKQCLQEVNNSADRGYLSPTDQGLPRYDRKDRYDLKEMEKKY